MGIDIFIVLLILPVVLPPYWLLYNLYRHAQAQFKKKWPSYAPPLTVVMPCKGTDLTFRANLTSLLEQNYPDFEVIFVTATENDPARDVIRELMAQSKVSTRLLVAGIAPHCGQKMNNMSFGIRAVRSISEVIVFLDGDVFIHPNYLRNMVEPLSDQAIGSCCGYHMFVPTLGNIGSLLRFEWSCGGLLTLADPKRNFSIGAATAIRREVLERIKILDRLSSTISDTFCFTNGVRSVGLKIHFEPRCLFISYDESSFQDMLAWSNRLVIISRNYSPDLWRLTVFSFTLSSLLLLGGLGSICLRFDSTIATGLALMIFLQMLHSQCYLWLLEYICRSHYPEQMKVILKSRMKLAFLASVIPFIISWNCINSIFSSEFKWRGIRYRIRGSNSVEVLPELEALVQEIK
jgi:cellulose synthase/poly-beta-1,6-N-acetylglucosamine synthase-like glycosyltransferase